MARPQPGAGHPLPGAARPLRRLVAALDQANAALERAASRPWRAAILIALATLLIRMPAWGDPNYHVDEGFYLLVADRMRAGATLYVDIWDRKPPGIYVINYLVGLVWPGMLAMHVAATLSVAMGAVLLFRLARLVSGPRGALLAALGYVVIIGRFGGAGAQTPVFYNTAMTLAAWLVVSRQDRLREGQIPAAIPLAMVAAGCALATKPTALPEAVWFGLFALWCARVAVPLQRLCKWAAVLAVAGAAPLLACGLWFAENGHFSDAWDAVVRSNFRRHYLASESWSVLGVLTAQLGFPLGLAGLAGWFGRERLRRDPAFAFVFIWLLVAVGAFLAFPNKADHYVLPLAAPLMACAAPFLDRRDLGLACAALMIAALLVTGETFNRAERRASGQEMLDMERYIRSMDPAPRLLVYAGPAYLYHALDTPPLGPLAFPPHLFDLSERDVSRYRTWPAFEAMLARHPTTIVRQDPVLTLGEDRAMTARVKAYAASHCTTARDMVLRDMYGPYRVHIDTRCRP